MRFTAPVGTNFRTASPVPLPALRAALEAIAGFLKSRDTDGYLLRYDDWWRHDGEHSPKGKLSWEAFGDRYETEAAIVASMPKREGVCVGICGPSMEWYLRYSADPAQGAGSLDLTVPAEWEADLREALEELGPLPWAAMPAEDYYRTLRSGATPVADGRAGARAAEQAASGERFGNLTEGISMGGGFGWVGKAAAGLAGAAALFLAYLWISRLAERL